MLRTYSIQTLGCKVNQYESEQLATLLRGRGLVPAADPATADLRIVNTCSVTVQAASKSRQTVRRNTRRLTVLNNPTSPDSPELIPEPVGFRGPGSGFREPKILEPEIRTPDSESSTPKPETSIPQFVPKVIVTGCWATSNPQQARDIPGVSAVLTHHGDVAGELHRLLTQWQGGSPVGESSLSLSPSPHPLISPSSPKPPGATSLPLLGERQTGHQRGFLKVQDGCDAHCTYCIIPKLRPVPWSKPLGETIEEARRLVAAGHVELVLTGIFLGAYGQPTALRRRQPHDTGKPLAELIHALCTRVPGLRRVRLSSLEPGDLTPDLLSVLKSHAQVVPHFHLPLQSGSDEILRRMNRQYTRDDFLRMVDAVYESFDHPALTTDIIVAFPGETDAEFSRTLEVVDRARFLHIHAFPFSPRPGTAAARWADEFVHTLPVANERIDTLSARAREHSFTFRKQFVGQTVDLLVERGHGSPLPSPGSARMGDAPGLAAHSLAAVSVGSPVPLGAREGEGYALNLDSHSLAAAPSGTPLPSGEGDGERKPHALNSRTPADTTPPLRHGRCPHYFDVAFTASPTTSTGDFVRVRIDRVTPDHTFGTLV